MYSDVIHLTLLNNFSQVHPLLLTASQPFAVFNNPPRLICAPHTLTGAVLCTGTRWSTSSRCHQLGWGPMSPSYLHAGTKAGLVLCRTSESNHSCGELTGAVPAWRVQRTLCHSCPPWWELSQSFCPSSSMAPEFWGDGEKGCHTGVTSMAEHCLGVFPLYFSYWDILN